MTDQDDGNNIDGDDHAISRRCPPLQRVCGRRSIILGDGGSNHEVRPSDIPPSSITVIVDPSFDHNVESFSDTTANSESTTATTKTATAPSATLAARMCDDAGGEAEEKFDEHDDDCNPPTEDVRVSFVMSNVDGVANTTSEQRVDAAWERRYAARDNAGFHDTSVEANGGVSSVDDGESVDATVGGGGRYPRNARPVTCASYLNENDGIEQEWHQNFNAKGYLVMSPERRATFGGVQTFLFLLEHSLAVAIALSGFALIRILSFSSSWPSRIFSTLVIVWIIKFTFLFLQSSIHRSAYEGSDRSENVTDEDEQDSLKLFEAIQGRRAQSQFGSEEGVRNASFEDAVKPQEPNNPAISRGVSCTMDFLMTILEVEKRKTPSTMPFPLFAVLATVLVRIAVPIVIIVQNCRRSFSWRRRRLARNGVIQFTDIPFTIGRGMSSTGCSFHILSFLNRLLENNVHDNTEHVCIPEVHPDDSPISLNVVSLDRISISTSHFLVNPINQLSRFGIRLDGIDIGVTILLNRKSRRVGSISTGKDLQSVSLQLQVKALEVGVFPFFFDWCRGRGIKLNARASFDVGDGDSPEYGKHSTLSGFGLSGALGHIFTCRAPTGVQAQSSDRAFSWDKMHSTLQLQIQNEIDSGINGRHSRRLMASSINFPSGFCLIHNSREGNTWVKSSSLLRRIHVNLSGQFSLGINTEHVARILVLLNEIPSPLIKNFPATKKNASKGESKNKSILQIVELNTVISMQLFTFVSKARLKNDRVTLDFLSLVSPNLSLRWKNDVESLPDSTGDHNRRDAKDRCDVPYSMLEASANGISLHHHMIHGDQLDCSMTEKDLVRLNRVQVKTGVLLDQYQKSDEPKCAIIDLEGILVRADGDDVHNFACTMKALEDVKFAVSRLQFRAKEFKQTVSSRAEDKDSQYFNAAKGSGKKARDALNCIKFSCKYVDVIVEVLVDDGDITNDEKVRVALLQMGTNVTILSNREYNNGESCDLDYSNFDVNLPDQLFDIGVKKCAQHHLFDASVARFEGSVTFQPHLTLPVTGEASPGFDQSTRRGCSQEVTFYAKMSKVLLKSAFPSNSRLNNKRSVFISKVISVTFDTLNICERFGQKLERGPSLLTVPVHKFSFQPDFFESEETGWPMARTYALYAVADLVKILQCKGSFCMTEIMSVATRERTEIILVHFNRGSEELEVVWSPILLWLEVSCYSRIQRVLACIKMYDSKKGPKKTFTLHKTNIRIGVDSNLKAHVHAYVGVKSYMCAVIEGGSTMNISTTTYSSSSSISLEETTTPNVSFEAKQINVHFNGISSNPIFVIEGISLKNYLRRAHDYEIYEYSRKKNISCDDELVTDRGGHPTKEIFEMRVGSSIKVKFPPPLHFGQIIEDMTLLPKALFDGLNRMKVDSKKRKRSYQLMSIKCNIPLLDVSLTDFDPGTYRSAGTSILREEFRILFEALEVSIERNEPPSWTQAQINSLDEDDSSTHLYGIQILGGFIRLAVKNIMCMIYPLSLVNPLLRINDFAINGYFYLAALSPTTPGVQAGKTVASLLLCHHNHSTGNCLTAHQYRQCSCCYGVSLHSTGIPVKLYVDGQVTCGRLNLMFGSVLSDSIPRLMECVQRLLPPKSEPDDEVTAKLTWWDNARFFIHGCISISADELSFRWLLDSHTFWNRSIVFHCKKCEMRHSVGLFSVVASDIYVSIPGTAYDMSIHPSARDTKPEAESVVSSERHPLLYVPILKAKIQISWEMLHPDGNSCKHHSIYMIAESHEEMKKGDKFAAFRTGGVNVQLSIDLPGSDCIGADNWVALRVDVLPWFSHVNSPSKISRQNNENDSNPFPTLRSVVMEACVKNIKMATWFENEENLDGLCLIVKAVKYDTSTDGGKEIIIEGPAKAALLDVSEFRHVVNAAGDIQERKEMVIPDQMKSEFGTVRSWSHSEVNENSTQPASFRGEDFESPLFLKLPFLKLQELSTKIGELDYVVVISQIDICNKSLTEILAVPSELRRTTMQNSKSLDIDRTTWSILVARCRLLWTLEIRDSIMGISNDLIYTIGFMNSQRRQLQQTNKEKHKQEQITGGSCEVSSSFVGEGMSHSRHDSNNSQLEYLLAESFHAEQTHDVSVDEHTTKGGNSTLPTLDIHFSNPQVQLHSIATGGSILLAMEQAQVAARKFVHFIITNARSKGKVSPSDLLRKTEHTYTLKTMEAYSLSTRVDVNRGLPWLEVCSPENDGTKHSAFMHHRQAYPPNLQFHEPLSFSKNGLLCPILDKFTFQSTQIFHRSPHHYSTQELLNFIDKGLVASKDEAAVDSIELLIDLLNFNLDSYQFKTTLDVLRNILLDVPKPHQRHQSGAQIDTSTKSSGSISSVAAMEMKQILIGDVKYRDKKGRQMLRSAAMSLLREVEDRIALEGSEVFRRISYTLGKLQWSMQSQDTIEDVQISLTRFHGQHDYSRNGSTVSQFSLEDLRVSSSKPGPDSIVFLDPTSVLKSVLGNERSACEQCGLYFDHSNNDLKSCVFHFGKYVNGIWTCCKSKKANALGCKSGPHSGKERAAVIRVESLPQTVDGLSLYSHFEVNLFPGIPHTMVIQISKSMSRLLMLYFFLDEDNDEEFDTISTLSDSTRSTETSVQSDFFLKSAMRKNLSKAQGAPPSGNQCIPSSGTAELGNTSSELKSPSRELVLFKVWRVGYVDVNVSVSGFKRLPRASCLDICVPAYSKAYEIGTWQYHGKKYLTHLVREVLKSGASSGLDKFRRRNQALLTRVPPTRLRCWTPAHQNLDLS
ncbi:hypothetical protein ACHAXA_007573 [Cyclostephanos tholiformis]|uniref:Fragile site-associated protein C-terminal domain-containing protein n=1 Tax=Cyclostephanos tholiformis TaxID=382380 RepID=A0ABD3SRT0_9STRA